MREHRSLTFLPSYAAFKWMQCLVKGGGGGGWIAYIEYSNLEGTRVLADDFLSGVISVYHIDQHGSEKKEN